MGGWVPTVGMSVWYAVRGVQGDFSPVPLSLPLSPPPSHSPCQACGVEALLYVLPHLFSLLGFPSLQGALIAAMATATAAMLSSLLPLTCLDELGRRPLAIISSAGAALAEQPAPFSTGRFFRFLLIQP